ncbi:serine/threonine protein kinase [Magnaporthiopsis poae ATCC 64411]|uniref:Serine/threonine protein kinase n=1 Tax=Magnaporthiopsis poae (strain ATCC 64411 / 73-15) TaxID=644358 RepID=A0A0C4DVX0_MAGP6|nr:serine/threonine protein kinase [Magnaporthiopsis poae ATCC 64411]
MYTSHDHFKELPGGHESRPANGVPASQTDGSVSDVCHNLGDTYPYSAAEDPQPHLPALSTQTTAEAPWQRLPPLYPDDTIEDERQSTDHLLAGISADRPPFGDPARLTKALAAELRNAMVETRCTAKGDSVLVYLPRDALFKLVTEASVAAVLQDEGMPRDVSQRLAKQICIPSMVMLGGGKKGQNQLSTRRKLFATLVLIYKASAIGGFIDEGILDTHLPLQARRGNGTWFLSLASRPAERLGCCRDWTADDVEMFDLRQWRFLSPFFADMQGVKDAKAKIMHYVLHYKIVPPLHFLSGKESNMDTDMDGGFGTVFRVRFNPHHHNFGPADERENLVLALKKLHSPNRAAFQREVEALKRFSHSGDPHLIKLLWTYEWRDNFYLVFPCAGGNLWDFTEKYANGPELTRDLPRRVWIEWLAGQCYGIAAALARIHGDEVLDPDGKRASGPSANLDPKQQQPPSATSAKKFGRHGDLKPENILWFPPGKQTAGYDKKIGILQVSDLGLSDFHGRCSTSNLPAHMFPMSGTYQAPECLTYNRLGRPYDLWTLGCVYIEFVSWFLLGHERTKSDFSQKRLDDDHNEIKEDTFFKVEADTLPVRASVKQSVLDWVKQLTKHPDCSGFLAEFLAYILSDILLAAPEKRAKSPEVAKRLHEMREKCQNDSSYCLERNKSHAPSRSPTFGSDIIYSNHEGKEVMESLARKGRCLTFPPQPPAVRREPLHRSLSETEETRGSPTSRLPQVQSSPSLLAPLLRPVPARESGVAELPTENASAQQQEVRKEPHRRGDYGTVSGLDGPYAASTPPRSDLPSQEPGEVQERGWGYGLKELCFGSCCLRT